MKFLTYAAVLILLTCSPLRADEHEAANAVLVTGASTGIGRLTAEMLANNGFFVYAGARKQDDLDALNAIDNMMAVRLDVTKQDEIEAAVKVIEREGRGLYGLVNNAGVFFGGPQTEVSIEDYKWLMDVNVFGVYRVTKAFAPMIIEAEGHISNVSSISGVASGPMFGHYSASKHAVEAMSDTLAMELAPFGVTVSVIEPGNYNSQIGETAYERMKDEPFAQAGGLYTDQVARIMAYTRESRDRFTAPDAVAEAILHAMTADRPLRRYMVVPNRAEAAWVLNKAVTELAEYNEWQAYPFTRDELVELLDDALSTRTRRAAELESLLDRFLTNTTERETHESFWADDLVYTSSNGTRFGKAEILEGFDSDPELTDDWPTYSARDTQVRIHGDTAIVTFKLVSVPAEGAEEPTRYYYNTGTFLERDGRWRAIAWQATKIPD